MNRIHKSKILLVALLFSVHSATLHGSDRKTIAIITGGIVVSIGLITGGIATAVGTGIYAYHKLFIKKNLEDQKLEADLKFSDIEAKIMDIEIKLDNVNDYCSDKKGYKTFNKFNSINQKLQRNT